MGKRAPRRRQALKAEPAWRALSKRTLASLIKDRPGRVLEVLDRHGVTFCAGCFLTLSSPVARAAAYHAVPDLQRFLKDLQRALDHAA